MKKIFSSLIACMALGMGLTSCSDVDIPSAVTPEKVSGLNADVAGRNVTLSWTNPAEAVGVNLYKTDALGEHLLIGKDSLFTSYLDKHVAVNQDLVYTVKARYADGRVSEGQSVTKNITYTSNTKVGYLIPYSNVNDIQDDDEKAAATWFKKTYANGVILTPADLDNLYPDEYSTIWIQIDRVGLAKGWENLPAELVSNKAIAALKQYVQDGGNLLLTKHATQLAVAIGRIRDRFAPGIFSAGEGGVGTDNWTMQTVIGVGQAEPYDHRSHKAFEGLAVNHDYPHETFGLEGPGLREDHNCMWDLNAYGLPQTSPAAGNVVKAFEGETSSTVLATWGHVEDYCCAGVVEFNPTATYAGRIIAIGLSAYEWDENGTANTYQGNIERFTKNCIDYLK
ncbi:DUF4960 domain-containing protein [Prevotella denticola]|uniref:DUF4960 domain-containing protein n=1 Tax=Prevotella denticola TaxID=28129 RepID=UPI001BA7AFB9|nr:DUF4960 domain-containing protein [Prevotella denticola]QUB92630.1 DUF4960 domain-containing protein [Prevotella denticola]